MNNIDDFVKDINYDLEILKLRHDEGSSFIYIYFDDLTLGFINITNNNLMNVNIPQTRLLDDILSDIEKIALTFSELQ